jgi:hypothetical protein
VEKLVEKAGDWNNDKKRWGCQPGWPDEQNIFDNLP